MKYYLYLLILATLSGCLSEKEESPCPVNAYLTIQYSPLVFSFINTDSTNLLENKTIDTLDISIKDNKGTIQKFSVFLDSTRTKARYISVPLSDKKGTNELIIRVKNRETSLKYDVTVAGSECGSYHIYDNYMLNAEPYQIQSKWSYSMIGNRKIETGFRIIYITEK